VPFLIALAVSLIGTAAMLRLGPRVGLVDRPGALKLHERPVPVAGVALALGGILGAWPVLAGERRTWFVVAVVVALAGGLLDDVRPLSPWTRLPVQVLAGLCLAAAGFALEPFGSAAPAALVVVTVACCNAVNMIDGQDGLAAGLGALAAAGLAGVAVASGSQTGVALAVAGACLGFLVWNRPQARAFLGDGGAYALGVLLAAAAAGTPGWPGLSAAGVCLTLFVVELTWTVLRRLRSATSPVLGDREHTYDRLAVALGSRSASTYACWSAGALLALAAQPVARLPAAASFVAAAGALIACTAWLLAAARPPRRAADPDRSTPQYPTARRGKEVT
jgi:UDP-GlcNAc:undecaprenyl-phosphate GlcNAc-1-phosphate transferase